MLFFWYGLIQICHTHSQNTEIRDALIDILGVNCFHSIELITKLSKRRSHWTSHSFFHCIYCRRINDRFWFEETSTGLRSRYPQWVWKIWEYEKVWETAKKLMHEITTNIKCREKYRHTQKHRQAHKLTHEHTQTHTHTHTHTHTQACMHKETQEACLYSRYAESNLP
jgi:histone deacetylase complex regulatory component SIN3